MFFLFYYILDFSQNENDATSELTIESSDDHSDASDGELLKSLKLTSNNETLDTGEAQNEQCDNLIAGNESNLQEDVAAEEKENYKDENEEEESCESTNVCDMALPIKRRTYTLDFLYKFKDCKIRGDYIKDLNKCPDVIRDIDIKRTVTVNNLFPHFAVKGTENVIITTKSKKKALPVADRTVSEPIRTSSKERTKSPLKGKSDIIHVNLSIHEDVKLNEVQNAWRPSVFTNQTGDCGGEVDTENLLKQFRSILNKITPKNFDVLLVQVKEMKIEKPQHVDELINLVFEKAVAEPNFKECYTKLCQQISKMYQPPPNSSTRSDFDFKRKLITRVQHEFNTCIEISQKNVGDFESEVDYDSVRKRAIGSVQFVGELFNFELLSLKIMKSCAHNLLNCGTELAVELMCKLLSTIGSKMEKSVRELMIRQVREVVMSKKQKYPSRIRFMVLDLEDMHKVWIQNNVPSNVQKK